MTATAPPQAPAPPPPALAPAEFVTRAVTFTGIAAGTFLTVVSVMNGIRFPGVQIVPSVIFTWVLLVLAATTATGLLRRHRRALARHAVRHTRRGGAYAAGKAASRWQNRQHHPLLFTRAARAGGVKGKEAPPFAPVLLTARSTTGSPLNPMTGEPVNSAAVYDPDDLKRRLAAAAERSDIEVTTRPLHEYGPAERTHSMPDTRIVSDRQAGADIGRTRVRPQRHPATSGGTYSAEWRAIVAQTADFEPEDDSHLLEWMAAEVNGMSAYAEGLTEVYETCVNSVGLDPVAMRATHDVADAAAEAAQAMAAARQKFVSHYAEVREFAANGGLLPHNGRWITGDGDA
jgi:hypothetical protein